MPSLTWLIVALITFVMALAAMKMAIIALVVAGLIFRTRVTIGLLLVGGTMELIKAYPAVLFAIAGLFVIAATLKAANKSSTGGKLSRLEDHGQK